MNGSFARYHPVVQFLFFFSVMLFAMTISEPVCLIISFLPALTYMIFLGGRRALTTVFKYILPMFLFIGVMNPLFNHGGMTIIGYLPSGNPFTLESLLYGIAAGLMFSTILLWCACLRRIMTSDRVIYLFGKAAPRLSLLISMILRFIPRIADYTRQLRAAQKCIGRDMTDGNLITRFRNTVRIISCLIQWVLENSIDIADELKSKGYGLPHRTSFSLFDFTLRDGVLCGFILLCDAVVGWGMMSGAAEFYYFPVVSEITGGTVQIVLYAFYLLLCIMPIMLEAEEGIRWHYIRSGM